MRGWRTTWMVLLGAALAAACNGKEPTCPAGQTACGGVCVDTATDPNNCRFCGVRCPTGASCISSLCQCPAGQQPCGGACITLDTNENCGACGHACEIPGSVPLGTCGGTPPACTCAAPPVLDCGATASPQCVDGSSDQGNCGVCGHACGLGSCAAGACTCNTNPGVLDCGSGTSPQCVNTLTDPNNCGGCGTHCGTSTPTCSAGLCCPIAQTNCSGTCRDLLGDSSNCGTCGNVCPGGQPSCSVGHCCPTGFTWCGGPACVDTTTDPANCGLCGHTCSASQACAGSTCQCQAPTPLTCGTNCCAGTACCAGNTCQPLHDNGLGGHYFDCATLGVPGNGSTYTAGMALKAGEAWNPSGLTGTTPCGGGNAWQVQSASSCAVWQYQGPLAGHVNLNTQGISCICPTADSPTWN